MQTIFLRALDIFGETKDDRQKDKNGASETSKSLSIEWRKKNIYTLNKTQHGSSLLKMWHGKRFEMLVYIF